MTRVFSDTLAGAMAGILFVLGLCTCSYAQLIYPDQYELMKASATPLYNYQATPPEAYRNTAFAAPLALNSSQQANNFDYNQIAGPAAATAENNYGPAAPQAVSLAPDWEAHVNNIITRGVSRLALNIEKQVYSSQSATLPGQYQNIVFSPISITVTLALVLLGSAGRTFDEVSRVLGLETGVDITRHSEIVHQMFGSLLTHVQEKVIAISGPRVEFASAMFVQDGYPIRPEYSAVSRNVYQSGVVNVDFQRRAKEAQNIVNNWVRQMTMGKISSILTTPPNPQTKAILISALYFNGEWNQHFSSLSTSRKPFYIEPNQAIDVDMMLNGGRFFFYEDRALGVKILRLPYKGLETSMYVLLPTAKGAAALRDFQNQLTPDMIETLINKMRNETCIIALPRMKISSTLSLSSTLASLGLRSLFNPTTADLSLLSQGYSRGPSPLSRPSQGSSIPVPTVAPLNQNAGSVTTERPRFINNNDLYIFSRFGEEDQTTEASRKNFFTYQDKTRGLTVEQWATGFSIGKSRRIRRNAKENNGAPKLKSFTKRRTNNEEERNAYVTADSDTNHDRAKVVNMKNNKYRFENTKKGDTVRRKRQAVNMDQAFLEYIRSRNFLTYGLDDLRNSANLVNPGLYASEVLHKVEIDITEKGTEAAAVTAVVLERDGSQKRVIANRPFSFFIRHDTTKLMLFWGTINVPTPNYIVT